MHSLQGKSVLITGAGSGIGRACAIAFAESGARVIAVDLDLKLLKDLKSSYSLEIIEADLTKPEKFFPDNLEIDILINNAGFGVAGPLETMSSADWKSMFDTNVHGIFYVTKRLIPAMKLADEGHIINVASIAGLNGVTNFAGYVGTKHAVRGISHSLYMELRDFGIKVSTIYPGSIQTNFFDAIPGMDAHEHMMQPEDVALTIVQTLETHPNYFVVDVECRPLRPKGKK